MTAPDRSDFFAVATVEYRASVTSPSYGDLWPSAWADDGALYAACGDGLGFSDGQWSDIVVSRIDGDPCSGLTGERLASGRDVAPVWTDPGRFNSKPTGMIAVDGDADGRDELYLAVQDLRCGDTPDVFDHAPAAGIVRSDDYGRSWSAGEGVMFSERFTTVMFLDFGRSHSQVKALRGLGPAGGPDPAGFAYAYGLDHNWRASISGVVPDPVDLFLARVPIEAIQDRSRWEFFAGHTSADVPGWTRDIDDKQAVLTDTTRRHTDEDVLPQVRPANSTVIAQGGIVYVPALRRFLYSSWSELTFEFYEAPAPWGPWRHFLSTDFGPQPWTGPRVAIGRHGGYAPTIPSKFISRSGRDAWVQSNWFGGAPTYTGNTYHFSLRKLRLDPMVDPALARRDESERPGDPMEAGVPPLGTNLASLPGTAPTASACRSGQIEVLNDGRRDLADDSWNGCRRGEHHWGYCWPAPQHMSRLVYVTGPFDCSGGWFGETPRVQVRDGAGWCDVDELVVSPSYPCDRTATGTQTFTFEFSPAFSSGIRLVGTPGSRGGFYTSIAELEVYGDSSRSGTGIVKGGRS